VVIDIFQSAGLAIAGYCEQQVKDYNPFELPYLGDDRQGETVEHLRGLDYFIAIGDNMIRRKVSEKLSMALKPPVNAIHPRAIVSPSALTGHGVMIAAGAVINPLVVLGHGVICNSSCSIDHECIIGAFSHVAPGAVLSGNVRVGENSFIGAGAVVRQGVEIGSNVVIGAGAVIVRDVPDNKIIVGNPGRELIKNKTNL
jgi:sugar O-acyltransferase (sialic acid O-acetyltransferase NeuD family)